MRHKTTSSKFFQVKISLRGENGKKDLHEKNVTCFNPDTKFKASGEELRNRFLFGSCSKPILNGLSRSSLKGKGKQFTDDDAAKKEAEENVLFAYLSAELIFVTRGQKALFSLDRLTD